MVKNIFKFISRLGHCFLNFMSGILTICLLVIGVTNAKATTFTPEQAVLEERISAVRHLLNEQSSEIESTKTDSNRLAQWPNWPNWNNWGNWPNWPNWPNWGNY